MFDISLIIDWMKEQHYSLTNMIDSLTRLMNEVYPKFYGDPGIPSDLKGLFYVAKSIAKVFNKMIKWSIDVQSVAIDKEAENLKEYLSKFCNSTIRKIYNFPKVLESDLKKIIERLNKGETNIKSGITLSLDIDEGLTDLYCKEIARLSSLLKD